MEKSIEKMTTFEMPEAHYSKFYMNVRLAPNFNSKVIPQKESMQSGNSLRNIQQSPLVSGQEKQKQRHRVLSLNGNSSISSKASLIQDQDSFSRQRDIRRNEIQLIDNTFLFEKNNNLKNKFTSIVNPAQNSWRAHSTSDSQTIKRRQDLLLKPQDKKQKYIETHKKSAGIRLLPIKCLDQTKSNEKVPQILPLVQVFLLNRISKFEEGKRNFIRFNIQQYVFANFKKEILPWIDFEVLQRAYSFIQKAISKGFTEKKYLHLRKCSSKRDLMRLFDEYDSQLITKEEASGHVSHYFLPSIQYRRQIMSDMISAINKEGGKQLQLFENIESIFDVNGNQIQDIFDLPFGSQIIFAGKNDPQFRKSIFFQEMQEFIKGIDNTEFIDSLKQKASLSFNVSISPSNSPYDSPRKLRSSIKKVGGFSPNFQEINLHEIPTAPYYYKATLDNNNSRMASTFDNQSYQSSNSKLNKQYNHNNSNNSSRSEIKISNEAYKNNHSRHRSYSTNRQIQGKMDTKELMRIRESFPQLENKDIFRFNSEFESLHDLNEGYEKKHNIESPQTSSSLSAPFQAAQQQLQDLKSNKIYAMNYFAFCTNFEEETHQSIMSAILRALGLDVQDNNKTSLKLSWDQFLLARTLTELKAEKEQNIDFLERLFDPMKIGFLSKSKFLDILQTPEKLIDSTKLYPHQMWGYLSKQGFIDEKNDLIVNQIKNQYDSHRFSIQFFMGWILKTVIKDVHIIQVFNHKIIFNTLCLPLKGRLEKQQQNTLLQNNKYLYKKAKLKGYYIEVILNWSNLIKIEISHRKKILLLTQCSLSREWIRLDEIKVENKCSLIDIISLLLIWQIRFVKSKQINCLFVC